MQFLIPKAELLIEKKCECCEAIYQETFKPGYQYSFQKVHRDLVFVQGRTRVFNLTERYIESNFHTVEHDEE